MAGIGWVSSKVKASSLLEVMVALVVIFTVFGISMGLYVNVISSSANLQQTKAMAEMEKVVSDMKKTQNLTESVIEAEGFSIEKVVEPYAGNADLIKLHLKAVNSEHKTIADLHEIILIQK